MPNLCRYLPLTQKCANTVLFELGGQMGGQMGGQIVCKQYPIGIGVNGFKMLVTKQIYKLK